MSEELNKLAKAMRDMSDMVGDHHWMAAKAVEDLVKRDARIAELDSDLKCAHAMLSEISRAGMVLRAELSAIKAQEPVAWMAADGSGAITQEKLDGLSNHCGTPGRTIARMYSRPLYAAPVAKPQAEVHSTQDNYEHFLSYSALTDDPMLRYAYFHGADADCEQPQASSAQSAPAGELRVVFDAPPGPEGGRFIEVEDAEGKSFNAGEWRQRNDGLWELVIIFAQPQGVVMPERMTVNTAWATDLTSAQYACDWYNRALDEIARLNSDPVNQVSVPDGEDWGVFFGYLIDKCEGHIVAEENLQGWLSEMLADPHYGALFRREKTPAEQFSPVALSIEAAEEEHGSLRAAAKALGIDPGYLSRLKSGEKINPSAEVLKVLGLERITYYRSMLAAAPAPGGE